MASPPRSAKQREEEEEAAVGDLATLMEQRGEFGLPSTKITPVFDSEHYWSMRYIADAQERPLFDWYAGGEELWPTLQTLLRNSDEILEIGCGNSPLSEYLWMQKRAQERQMGITYRTMDVRSLDYSEAQFHVVLDKAGSDALYYTGADEQRPDFSKMNKEVHRVLKADGAWIVVTRKTPLDWFAPQFRLRKDIVLQDEQSRSFHVYVLEKSPPVQQKI